MPPAQVIALSVCAGTLIALGVQGIIDGNVWPALLGGGFVVWLLYRIFARR